MLISTKIFPPGGFAYAQPETGWKTQPFLPFSEVAKSIADHRRANKLAHSTIAEAAADLAAHTCQRLGNDPAYCDNGVKKNSPNQPPEQVAAGLVAGIGRKLYGGAQIMRDWLGDGLRTVEKKVAQNRADVCTGRLSGKRCAYNTRQGISELTGPIADFIKAQIQRKTELHLSVENETDLETCSICLCVLRLKIWTPLDIILARTPERGLAEFKKKAPWCWLLEDNPPSKP